MSDEVRRGREQFLKIYQEKPGDEAGQADEEVKEIRFKREAMHVSGFPSFEGGDIRRAARVGPGNTHRRQPVRSVALARHLWSGTRGPHPRGQTQKCGHPQRHMGEAWCVSYFLLTSSCR